MLRRFLDLGNSFFERYSSLAKWRPLFTAVDTFCFQAHCSTRKAPFIRDAMDLKRMMMIVVYALLPCVLMAILNTGVQKMVYTSHNYLLMKEFGEVGGLWSYLHFIFGEGRLWTIFKLGLGAFLPIMTISYMVGGLCEMVVAVVRKHEISEGFLVTGLLYPLILPPTIPYWMAALGIAFGVIFGKELFGGTGMNILNPALCARAFLFFTFPGKMSGDVWVGTNPTKVVASLAQMNAGIGVDGISQATPLAILNATNPEIKKIHVEAIASKNLGISSSNEILDHFSQWKSVKQLGVSLESLSSEQLQQFVTGPIDQGGLSLDPAHYKVAVQFVDVAYGAGKFSDGNLFFGNQLGSMGETSVLACLLGAFVLIYTGVGAWRTMVSFGLFAFLTALLFQTFGGHNWDPAKFMMPAYRHLMMGGLAFGLVYMATDPVSSPTLNLSKWIYGGLIGCVTIVIRLINPAFPEGVMLAILLGNVFAPLIDHFSLKRFRRRKITHV